jgi:hypothetical protein
MKKQKKRITAEAQRLEEEAEDRPVGFSAACGLPAWRLREARCLPGRRKPALVPRSRRRAIDFSDSQLQWETKIRLLCRRIGRVEFRAKLAGMQGMQGMQGKKTEKAFPAAPKTFSI